MEEKHAFKLVGNLSDAQSEKKLLMSMGMPSYCMSPELKDYLSTELSKEAAVAKERREAREERQLTRKGGGEKGAGGGKP